jgi:hypothetical protein
LKPTKEKQNQNIENLRMEYFMWQSSHKTNKHGMYYFLKSAREKDFMYKLSWLSTLTILITKFKAHFVIIFPKYTQRCIFAWQTRV